MIQPTATKAALLAASCCLALGACDGAPKMSAAAAQEGAAVDLTKVPIPQLKSGPGDVTDPLPEGSPLPVSDPKSFEGLWAGLGRSQTSDGTPPPYKPEVQAEMRRQMDRERAGTPVVRRGTLCRPPGALSLTGNQFPIQILQRPEKILIIAEENRGIWSVYMNAEHPADVKPTYTGHNVGRWEGNTLVIDTVGLRTRSMGMFGGASGHVVTRITRANTGDKLNGDRVVVEQTIDDPSRYTTKFTSVHVARWRPDLQLLEFNCEESDTSMIAKDLNIE